MANEEYGLNLQTTFHTKPTNPAGPCIFRIEIWPLPQELVGPLNEKLIPKIKEILREMDIAGDGEADLTGKGPMQ